MNTPTTPEQAREMAKGLGTAALLAEQRASVAYTDAECSAWNYVKREAETACAALRSLAEQLEHLREEQKSNALENMEKLTMLYGKINSLRSALKPLARLAHILWNESWHAHPPPRLIVADSDVLNISVLKDYQITVEDVRRASRAYN